MKKKLTALLLVLSLCCMSITGYAAEWSDYFTDEDEFEELILETETETAEETEFETETEAESEEEDDEETTERSSEEPETNQSDDEYDWVVQNYVFIGDSRTTWMHTWIGDVSDVTWSNASGQGYDWMMETGLDNPDSAIGEGTAVFILLGVNDLWNIDKYIESINEKAPEWTDRGARVFFCSVGPVDAGAKVTNEEIEEFNAKLEEGLVNVEFLDLYTAMVKNGYETTDSLHYTQETTQFIYDFLRDYVSETTDNAMNQRIDSIISSTSESESEDEESETFYTTAQLNIRDNPEGNIIGTYSAYAKVEVYESKDGWGRTDKGWVSEQYLSTKNLSSAGNVEDWSERTLKEGASFDEKVKYFADEAEDADYSHVSDTLFATITSNTYGSGFYYLTHIIVQDPESQMKGALSNDVLGGSRETTTSVSERKNAVVATNASYFYYEDGYLPGQPLKGVIITDGEVTRSGTCNGYEMCLTKDGELFSASTSMTSQDLINMGVTDTWTTMRPTLIADGALKTWSSDQTYPRCAYGMVEPGEYYIITAGTSGYNGGLTQKNLQEIFATLGCTYARPLDEGGSATLVFENQLINTPAAGEERPVVDFIYITD